MLLLVVEDEVLIAMDLEEMLVGAGHEVLGPVPTIQEALALAERQPDLALLDINLRNGESGIELARELCRRWNIPSLFLSGSPDEALANKDAALGFVRKPYERQTVLKSIEIAKEAREEKPGTKLPAGFELFTYPN